MSATVTSGHFVIYCLCGNTFLTGTLKHGLSKLKGSRGWLYPLDLIFRGILCLGIMLLYSFKYLMISLLKFYLGGEIHGVVHICHRGKQTKAIYIFYSNMASYAKYFGQQLNKYFHGFLYRQTYCHVILWSYDINANVAKHSLYSS